jgi:hypothetical protein
MACLDWKKFGVTLNVDIPGAWQRVTGHRIEYTYLSRNNCMYTIVKPNKADSGDDYYSREGIRILAEIIKDWEPLLKSKLPIDDHLRELEAKALRNNDYKPGTFGCHEAMHEASRYAEWLAEFAEHPAIAANPEWSVQASVIAELMMQMYQDIAKEHMIDEKDQNKRYA